MVEIHSAAAAKLEQQAFSVWPVCCWDVWVVFAFYDQEYHGLSQYWIPIGCRVFIKWAVIDT